MRKLGLILMVAMFAAVSTSAFAQEGKEAVAEQVQQAVQDKVEIQVSELPEAVTNAISESYADYTAEKAYKAVKEEKEVYYVKLSSEGKNIKVLFDADGNVLEEHEITDSM